MTTATEESAKAVNLEKVSMLLLEIEELALKKNINADVTGKLADLISKQVLTFEDLNDSVVNSIIYQEPENCIRALEAFEKSDKTYVTDLPSFLRGFIKSGPKNLFNLVKSADDCLAGNLEPDDFIKEYCKFFNKMVLITAGQRKIGPPEQDLAIDRPPPGSEVFLGNLPRHINEKELLPHLAKVGPVYEIRIMWDSDQKLNKGYGFAIFNTAEEAKNAVKKYDNFKIDGCPLKVSLSTPNTRLYVAGIPKSKSKDDIFEEYERCTGKGTIKDVIIYEDVRAGKKNRGFAFLEYRTHNQASTAKKILESKRVLPFNMEAYVEWAEALYNPGEEEMKKVRALFVKFGKKILTEQQLLDAFKQFGDLEHVNIRDNYAFVHFREREDALKAMDEMKGKEVGGAILDVTLARPRPTEEKILKSQQKMTGAVRGGGKAKHQGRGGGRFAPYPPPPRGPMEEFGYEDPTMVGAGFEDPSMMEGMYEDPAMMAGYDPSMMGAGFEDPSMMGGYEDPSAMGGYDDGQFYYPAPIPISKRGAPRGRGRGRGRRAQMF